ncbi:MAG: V-type ATP synthase subunit E [Treponema sp.]|jgi:V/A-type H+-transporting ATPase subunit E|nr:V-type ATP synthase subunit E [Treponema sp.]
MDIQLQELIDRIKKEGVESASMEAARVKANAEAEAKKIVETAQKEAAGIIAKAKADAERLEKAGTAALAQASRNLILAFQGEIQTLLDKIVLKDVSDAFSEDTLKKTLPEILKAWASKGSDSFDVILSEKDLKKTQAFFDKELARALKTGVELKSDRNLAAGFRIANKDGSAYYDFSATAAAEMLSAYLNPRLAEILKTAVKG